MFGLGKLVEVATILLGHEVVKNGLDRLGKVTVERIEKLTMEDPRRDVVHVIHLLEKEADGQAKADVLWGRLREAGEMGVENITVISLGRIVPRDDKGDIEEAKAVGVFSWLAEMDRQKFELVIEAMKHDPIAQFLRFWVGKVGSEALESASFAAGFGLEISKSGYNKLPDAAAIDQKAEEASVVVRDFRLWLESKGVR